MLPKPHGENLLVMRYRPSAEQSRKTLMVHLAAKRDGELLNFETDYSTFEQHDGTSTFKVFEVQENTYHPTLLLLEDGKPPQRIKCKPIPVSGRTDVMLVANPK